MVARPTSFWLLLLGAAAVGLALLLPSVRAQKPPAIGASRSTPVFRPVPWGPGPVIPLAEAQIVQEETLEIAEIYNRAAVRMDGAPQGIPGGRARIGVLRSLREELETFVRRHPNSAYTPGTRLRVAQMAHQRLGYSRAITEGQEAYLATRNLKEANAQQIFRDAAVELVRLYSKTGRTEEQIALEKDVADLGIVSPGPEWAAAVHRRQLLAATPEDAYKCGIYSVILLAKQAQAGEGDLDAIRETPTTSAGLSGSELVDLARKNRVWIRAVKVTDFSKLPVPCVLHLASDHYVFVTEQVGELYRVVDTVSDQRQVVVSPEELADEASGCVLIPADTQGPWAEMSVKEAGRYFGRCHSPNPDVDEDQPGPPANCGMGGMSVNQPYLNSWSSDTALKAADGTPGTRFAASTAGNPLQNNGPFHPWSGGLFPQTVRHAAQSSITMDPSALVATVALPHGGKLTAPFPSTGTVIESDYRGRRRLERFVNGGGATVKIVITHPDGSYLRYEPSQTYATELRLKAEGAADGTETLYDYIQIPGAGSPYDAISKITTAGGIVYTFAYNLAATWPTLTSITGSDGKMVTYGYGERTGQFTWNAGEFTSATDGRGLRTEFNYLAANDGRQVVTPYGVTETQTTLYPDPVASPFAAKLTVMTHPDGQQEAWAQLRETAPYGAFTTPQIPVVPAYSGEQNATLDWQTRGARNTVYWTAQQYAIVKQTPLASWGYAQFVRGETRHWLARLDTLGNSHFDTLSWVQAASPDGNIPANPDVTWYDYAGKRLLNGNLVPHEVGTNVLPSVVARVMPDGSTWYKRIVRNFRGNPTFEVEGWREGGIDKTRTTAWEYDAGGRNVTKITDPMNRISRFEYQNNRLFRSITPLNETNEFLYDTLGRLVDAKYYTGRRVISTYTPIIAASKTNGWILNETEYFGVAFNSTRSENREWNIALPWTNRDSSTTTLATTRTISTDARGLVVTRFIDALDRLVEERTPTATNRWWHEALTTLPSSTGQKHRLGVTLATTPVGSVQSVHNSRQRVTEVIDARGYSTRFDYCACGSPTQIREYISPSVDRVTSFDYDFQGKRKQVTYPDNTTLNIFFDALARPVRFQDAYGFTTNTLDNLGRVVEVRNANGRYGSATYNLASQPLTTVNSAGVGTTAGYEGNGRLSTLSGAGWSTSYGYTPNIAGPTSFTDGVNNVTQFAYNAAGLKTNEIKVGLSSTAFLYNGAGDLRYLHDGNNKRTEWRYDTFGRVSEKWYDSQLTADLVYSYDLIGRVTNRLTRTAATGGSGTTSYNTGYGYDANHNLTSVTYGNGSPALGFVYDTLNQLSSDSVAGGIANTYTYAPRGGLATEAVTAWASSQLTLAYTAGQRTSLSLQQPGLANWTTTYQYDAGRRLTNLVATSGAFAHGYTRPAGVTDAASPLLGRINVPVTTGTAFLTNTFDSLGRLNETALYTTGASPVNRHAYQFDAAFRVTQQTRPDATVATYGYDVASQLVSATTAGEVYGYGYDPGQNLIRRTNNAAVTAYPVNALNQVTGGSFTYGYDRPGNRVSSSNYETYVYDGENQLIQYRYEPPAPGVRTDFEYDARLRLRVRRDYTGTAGNWTLASTTRYLYDGMRVLQERNAINAPLVTYTRGLDLAGSWEKAGGIGGLLARTAHSAVSPYGPASHAFYHADRGGNITYLLNADATAGATYKYDPFGRLVTSSGTLAAANTYRFSSKEWIATAGLYYYGYRFYDPLTQRWMNRDPLGESGGRNIYGFVGNRPTGNLDAFGLYILDEDGFPIEGSYNGLGAYLYDRGTKAQHDKIMDDAAKALGPLRYVPDIAGACFEPLDWALTAGAIYQDPNNPWSYAGLLPFVPSGVGKVAGKVEREALEQAAKGIPQLALPTIRQAEGGLVIGRGADLSRPFALAPNEFRLSWPATATTRSEWKINSGLLRTEMGKGIPIRDASPGNVGGMYLNAERNLLESRGWNYNSSTGYWNPAGN